MQSPAPPDPNTFFEWIEEASQATFEHPEKTRRRIEPHIGNDEWVLSVIKAAIDGKYRRSSITAYLISYLSDEGLSRLVADITSANGFDNLSEEVFLEVGLQNPSLVPARLLEDTFEFTEWSEDFDFLASPATFHLILDMDCPPQPLNYPKYLPDHPTWHLKAQGRPLRLGGEGMERCLSCKQSLIHLISLEDEVLGQLSVSIPRLVFETCPTCWEKKYYRHDNSGMPAQIEPIEREGFSFENCPLVQQTVRVSPTPSRWLRQRAFAMKQNRFKIGGFPSWVQADETPVVPGTSRKMRLLIQLDSNLPTIDGGEMLWGSGGTFYVFWDDATRTSCHFHQCT